MNKLTKGDRDAIENFADMLSRNALLANDERRPGESDLQHLVRMGYRCRVCGSDGGEVEVMWYGLRGRWRAGTYCGECVEATDYEVVELI